VLASLRVREREREWERDGLCAWAVKAEERVEEEEEEEETVEADVSNSMRRPAAVTKW
jgi:hypothetical protein